MRYFLLLFLLIAGASAGETPFLWTLEREPHTVHARVRIASGYYLYAKEVRLDAACGTSTLKWTAPSPVMREKDAVYPAGSWEWSADVPAGEPLSCLVTFQGCSESGECLLPETIQLAGSAPEELPAPSLAGLPDFEVVQRLEGVQGKAEFLAFLQGGTGEDSPLPTSGLWMCFLALIGGVMLNFTPCVLPLIPVNLAIIGAGGNSSWKTGLVRASIYGAGMALAYGTLGAAAVLTGTRFGALNGSSVFNLAISVIFFFLALAMFGVFQLDLSPLSRRVPLPGPERRGAAAAFLLGILAALLAGACVAPVLIAVIVYAANLYSTGNPAGLLLPLLLGIGMALPWPAAGAGLAVLPKPGIWMKLVKNLFALLILAAAGYYAFCAWSLLPGRFRPEKEVAKLNTALRTGRPVVVDFWASWCGNCREMENSTLSDPEVRKALEQTEFVRFQAEKLSIPVIKEVLDRCGVHGLPAFVILKAR